MPDLDVEISTNANQPLQAFMAMDVAERTQVQNLMKMQLQLRQLEAAQQSYGSAGVRAHQQVAGAATAAERAEQRLIQQYQQRMNLRHGAGTAVTQLQRRELAAFGGSYVGQPAPASVMATQIALRYRQEAAERLRAERAMSQQEREQARVIAQGQAQAAMDLRADAPSAELQAEYRRRMSLRNGRGATVTQLERQMVQQADRATIGPAAGDLIDDIEQRQFSRWLIAQRHRETRRRERGTREAAETNRIELERVRDDAARGREDLYTERARRRLTPYGPMNVAERELLEARIAREAAAGRAFAEQRDSFGYNAAASLRQRTADQRDVFTRRARRELTPYGPQPARRSAEGELLEAQIEARAQQMQRRAQLAMTAMTTAATATAAMIYTGYQVGEWDRQRYTAAGERIEGQAAGRRSLRQIAGSPGELTQMLGASDTLANTTGMSADEANQAVFAAKSADDFNPATMRLLGNAYRMNVNPEIIMQALQKTRSNFGNVGTDEQLASKLLTAAGPSPAKINDISLGVGMAAQSWARIGGTPDELFATVSALGIGGKSTESGSMQLKTLATQLAKMSGQIEWGSETPLRGLSLVESLPRLAAENRLRNAEGKVVHTPEAFLQEQRAIQAYQQIGNQSGFIRDLAAKQQVAAASDAFANQATWGDPQADAAEAAGAAKRYREQQEQQKFGVPQQIGQAMYDTTEAGIVGAGDTSAVRAKGRELAFTLQSNGVIGTGMRGAINRMVFQGEWGDEKTLAQYFRDRFGRESLSTLNAVAKGNVPGPVPAGATGTFLDALTPGFWTGDQTPVIPDEWTPAQRDTYQRVAHETIAKVIAERSHAPAADGGSAVGLLGPAAGWLGVRHDSELETRDQPGDDHVDQVRKDLIRRGKLTSTAALQLLPPREAGVMSGFDEQLVGFEAGNNLSPDDYRVKIAERVSAEQRSQAYGAIHGAAALGGLNLNGANPFMPAGQAAASAALRAVPGLTNRGVYEANIQLIQNGIADAGHDVEEATDPADKADKLAKLRRMRQLQRNAKLDDGIISYGESQAIADAPEFAAAREKASMAGTNNSQGEQMIALLKEISAKLPGSNAGPPNQPTRPNAPGAPQAVPFLPPLQLTPPAQRKSSPMRGDHVPWRPDRASPYRQGN